MSTVSLCFSFKASAKVATLTIQAKYTTLFFITFLKYNCNKLI